MGCAFWNEAVLICRRRPSVAAVALVVAAVADAFAVADAVDAADAADVADVADATTPQSHRTERTNICNLRVDVKTKTEAVPHRSCFNTGEKNDLLR